MAAALMDAIMRRVNFQNTAWLAAALFVFVGVGSGAATAGDPPARSGMASSYSSNGKKTASGEFTNSESMTAAHRSLPFGTRVRVTNNRNGHSVVLRINDRGPFTKGRLIDVTPAAARSLGFSGVTQVNVSVLTGDGP
jgi:rare lipoprotein A